MRTEITVSAKGSEEQKAITHITIKITKEFPDTKINVETKSKKLLPEEVILLIAVEVSAGVVLRVLDKLWKYLKEGNLEPRLVSMDQIQETAENFLRRKGLHDFRITKKENLGLYTVLTYKKAGYIHEFHISNSDLSILRYEEKKL